LIVLRSLLRFCQERNWTAANPAQKLKAPKIDAPQTMPFTDNEVDRMLEACDRYGAGDRMQLARARKRARALLLILLYTGLRISDAVKLKRDAVDFKTGKVLLRIMKTKTPFYTKLPAEALEALKALPVESPDYFLWSGKCILATAISSASKAIRSIAKEAGVADAHPHRFRDTFSVTLLQNGVSIRTVQLLLGHSSVVTTEKHYAPFVEGMQRVVDEAVSGLQFGHSHTPAVVDSLRHAGGNTQRDARRPLPFQKPA
jgi:integrase